MTTSSIDLDELLESQPADDGPETDEFDRVGVEGDFDLAVRSPSDFSGGSALVTVEPKQRTTCTLQAIVTFVDPRANPDGTYPIRVTVENRQSDGKWLLVPGTLVTLTIHAAESRSQSSDSNNPGAAPPNESESQYRFPTELHGKWQIAKALTGGHANDAYAGQFPQDQLAAGLREAL